MKKQTKKVLKIYPSFCYNKLELWLKNMSLKGWHLTQRKLGMFYYFEKGLPVEKEYFVWDATDVGEGQYSIGMRYSFLIKSLKKKDSKLNDNSTKKNDTIIEVDSNKIEELSFTELKKERNELYKNRFIKRFVIIAVVLVIIALSLMIGVGVS